MMGLFEVFKRRNGKMSPETSQLNIFVCFQSNLRCNLAKLFERMNTICKSYFLSIHKKRF